PTAGLHFTTELLEKIKNKGVIICEILLHVGLSTFRPVKAEKISEHKMHSEYFEISKQSADIINAAKDEGRRIIAVGTTSVRTLESASDELGRVSQGEGNTEIFIYPPYKFKCADALITNFHLPESTLLMLVSAFIGKEETMELYNSAIKEKYRFFSFGDAMFLY
ncbi:MAG: S-adenosylmethionine:tRNA ribosyltransferase-isomerase, partial [Firmicutes bacterium]|nr:S-adenosylmethionine:tRNA ribosyltransferase-isomerase [Bacillota bacterium]